MSDNIVTDSATEQSEEADTPSAEVVPTRYIPWVPVLAFLLIGCMSIIYLSILT